MWRKYVCIALLSFAAAANDNLLSTGTTLDMNRSEMLPLTAVPVPGQSSNIGAVMRSTKELPALTTSELTAHRRSMFLTIVLAMVVIYFLVILISLTFRWFDMRENGSQVDIYAYETMATNSPLATDERDAGTILTVFGQRVVRGGHIALRIDGFKSALTKNTENHNEHSELLKSQSSERAQLIISQNETLVTKRQPDFSIVVEFESFLGLQGQVDSKDEVGRSALRAFASDEVSDSARLQLQKVPYWESFAEARSQLMKAFTAKGFKGYIDVKLVGEETLTLCQNNKLVNFLHSERVEFLLALAIVPSILRLLYLKWHTKTVHVQMPIHLSCARFMELMDPLIAQHISNVDESSPLTNSERQSTPSHPQQAAVPLVDV